jgi:hypothetical protein
LRWVWRVSGIQTSSSIGSLLLPRSAERCCSLRAVATLLTIRSPGRRQARDSPLPAFRRGPDAPLRLTGSSVPMANPQKPPHQPHCTGAVVVVRVGRPDSGRVLAGTLVESVPPPRARTRTRTRMQVLPPHPPSLDRIAASGEIETVSTWRYGCSVSRSLSSPARAARSGTA